MNWTAVSALIIIVLVGGLIWWFTRGRVGDNQQPARQADNPYEALREGALNIRPEQLADDMPAQAVYGMVMDWHVGEGIITLVCFATGEASVYFSNGGGLLGGKTEGPAYQATQAYLQEAAQAYVSAKPVTETPLAESHQVNFYFLGHNGIRLYQVPMQYLEDQSSPMLELFERANELLTHLRDLQEQH